ncbi:hypothetical protein GmHk_10G028953 [Glycine max]|nr:hypothetical protein GmHk_10G028953 [Glycine max]
MIILQMYLKYHKPRTKNRRMARMLVSMKNLLKFFIFAAMVIVQFSHGVSFKDRCHEFCHNIPKANCDAYCKDNHYQKGECIPPYPAGDSLCCCSGD